MEEVIFQAGDDDQIPAKSVKELINEKNSIITQAARNPQIYFYFFFFYLFWK